MTWLEGFQETPVAVAALPDGEHFVCACAPEVRERLHCVCVAVH